jgi:DNA-binding transcriptional LysR family regulator
MDRFKLMETFVTVVQERSYTRAAGRLGVTRAMVSRRMQDLEGHLGVRLLHRDPHGVTVSSIGSDYFESCREVLRRVWSAEEFARSEVGTPRGDLKIVSTKTIGETVVAPLIAKFCVLYPDIKVEMKLAEGRLDYGERGYDVAIGSLPAAESNLTVRSIINLPRLLVASPQYISTHGTPRTPKDLPAHNCLDPTGAEHNTWRFRGKKGFKNVRVSGNPRCNTSTLIRHAALQGLGIAIVREYLVADDMKNGALVQVLPDFELDKHALYAIFPTDARLPMRVRVFVDFLVESLTLLPGVGPSTSAIRQNDGTR